MRLIGKRPPSTCGRTFSTTTRRIRGSGAGIGGSTTFALRAGFAARPAVRVVLRRRPVPVLLGRSVRRSAIRHPHHVLPVSLVICGSAQSALVYTKTLLSVMSRRKGGAHQ